MFKIFNKSGLGYGLRYKNNGEGEDLEELTTRWRGQWLTAHCWLGIKGKKQFYLPGMGLLRTRTVDAMGRQRREGWLQHCPPFLRPGSLHSPTFCWMLCDPSIFYHIWFWPSADAENTKPDHDEKSLHRHTIPCFASSKSPFGLQLGSRETPNASHPETEEERCLPRNQIVITVTTSLSKNKQLIMIRICDR